MTKTPIPNCCHIVGIMEGGLTLRRGRRRRRRSRGRRRGRRRGRFRHAIGGGRLADARPSVSNQPRSTTTVSRLRSFDQQPVAGSIKAVICGHFALNLVFGATATATYWFINTIADISLKYFNFSNSPGWALANRKLQVHRKRMKELNVIFERDIYKYTHTVQATVSR